jgi:hypothetical protein
VLALENPACAEIVVIENKLKAEEGADQTQRYASKDAVAALSRRLLPGRPIGEPSFVFLTLFPDQQPTAGNLYLVKRHSDLQSVAAAIPSWENRVAEQLIRDWLALTAEFYTKAQVSLSDKFSDKLSDDSGLDSGYLYFRCALEQLSLPEGLDLEWFFRSSQQGRRYYGAIISKEAWHPGKMTNLSDSWIAPFAV